MVELNRFLRISASSSAICLRSTTRNQLKERIAYKLKRNVRCQLLALLEVSVNAFPPLLSFAQRPHFVNRFPSWRILYISTIISPVVIIVHLDSTNETRRFRRVSPRSSSIFVSRFLDVTVAPSPSITASQVMLLIVFDRLSRVVSCTTPASARTSTPRPPSRT